MSYLLTIRKEAELDINSAFELYQKQEVGLGYDFLLCIEESLSKIERNPIHYKMIYKELRRIAVRRFPYRILYLVRNSSVIVTAVFHARKGSQRWESRT